MGVFCEGWEKLNGHEANIFFSELATVIKKSQKGFDNAAKIINMGRAEGFLDGVKMGNEIYNTTEKPSIANEANNKDY